MTMGVNDSGLHELTLPEAGAGASADEPFRPMMSLDDSVMGASAAPPTVALLGNMGTTDTVAAS